MADPRSLTVSWEDPAALAARAREMSGLEFLSAIRDGRLPPPPIQQLLGFSFEEVEDGRAVFACVPREQHFNPLGTVHGGLVGTLLDSALGVAAHSTLPQGKGYATLETKFNLVRAIDARTGRILTEGKVVHRGSRVITAEGYVTTESDGAVLAHGTSTCLVVG